ncbi:lipoprotein LipL36 [Leptospira borgpetersenii]|uniref:lipoprotein LipL36 n=1 Tax=Leptospira borgpetersenii TaxID=174 RepID=UPI0009BCDDCB|nr:lipoprotein LipL36 [Leptospira borgpetersenii]MBE8400548.1 lipoprotein LipL36 [Leptospira borgpetersenii serovar Tarassovi]MBE8403664.1 lipoprotein LipL36 [Leptospira borgpetersenii serovar Tarassovi]MBE8406880.1 lipoprotein LipL36 [Leptospira borgpetersenii serovar Tarassovi]MBE8413066.1 lipoprotein LipL36 [Leptospira borgpetersenii serovar Tarassovi]MBE8416404.1 lipoprotein LipL36 [Leptospira borgpetersenii serovar Tarassovi]
MKKNVMKFAAVAALAVALSACKKSENNDDDTITLALLYLVDQTSGNCVTLSKDDAAHSGAAGAGDGKPTYTATGTTRPKAACANSFNTAFIIKNDEAALTSAQANFQAAIDKANAADTNCTGTNSVSAALQTAKTALTLTAVQQALAADGGVCTQLGANGGSLNLLNFSGNTVSIDPNSEYLGKTVYLCSSEKAKETRIAILSLATFSTIAGSVATDMATHLAFKQKTAAVTASNFKWTSDATTKGRLISVSELTTAAKSGAALVAFGIAGQLIQANPANAVGTAARACAKGLLSKESEAAQNIAFALHDGTVGLNGAITGGVLDSIITTAQAEAVKEVLFTSLNCKYGDFDEEAAGNKTTVGTETNVKNIGTCPTTYPRY